MTTRNLNAEMRGHCIHAIRSLLHGRKHHRWGTGQWPRRHVSISVAIQSEHLRSLGPGAVEQPVCSDGSGVLGPVVTWWGAKEGVERA